MLLVGNNKYTRYENGGIVPPAVITDESDYEEQGTTGQDSGNEDDEDLDASEEIFLPQEEDDDPDFESRPSPDIDDEEILYRQMAYPPLPEYNPPIVDYQSDESGKAHNSSKYVSKKKDTRFHARERLGVLTPMEEVTEPPSSAGTEASGVHRSRNRHKNTRSRLVRKNKTGQTKDDPSNHPSDDQQKSILKSKSPLGSPDRRVKFVGAGSVTQSETESQSSEYSKNNSDHSTRANESSTIQEEDDDESHESGDPDVEDEAESISADGPINASPTMEQVEKVETWQLGSDNDNQEPPMSNIDAEFASILDDIIAELHSWDRLAGTGASISEVNASRQDHLANISSHLTSYLGQVSPSTVMSNLPQLIPLITSLLSLTEPSFRAQLSSLNAVNVFSDKLKDCKIQTGLKILPQADLTWLVRSLCDVSSESSKSVLKSVGTAALASLVKAAGPEMICEPILLILLGEDEKVPKRPEGSGNIVTTTGIPGGPPKTKATALDALTFALLTFPRDAFDLEVVARLACHCLLHNKRRVRQAALECLAVVAHSLTSGVALPLFRKFISEEELALISEVNNNSLNSEETPSPSKLVDFASHYDSELEIDPRIFGPPSKIPVPIKVSEAHQKLQTESSPKKIQAPTSPAKPVRRPNPTSAVSARISRHVLPSPNVEELVEYGVKIPANCQLLSRQSLKVGGQEESCDDDVRDASSSGGGGAVRHTLRERLSSGGESCSSVSNIEYTLLELDPILSTHGSSGGRRNGRGNNNDGSQEFIIAPDVEWILNGTGAVKKCDPTTMLPKELSILAPGTTKYQQWNNNLGSKSGNESDFSSSVASSQTRTLGGGNNSDNNMKRINSTRNDLLQDSFVQEPVLGRYYYPPTSHIVSPRAVLNTSDPLSSRFSSKSSYNLLPSKYTVMRNTNQYRGGGHDLVSPHVLLPGAYDNPYVSNAYSDSSVGTTGSWHSDLGSLSKINLKPKPLEPIQSLREKFFESARRNETLRSDSQQSGATEEESEPEHEKTESQHIKPAAKPAPPKQRNQNVNQESRKPPIAPRPMVPPTNLHADNISKGNKRDGVTSQDDEVSVRRQTETLIHGGVSREYHVYNSRVEIDPAAAARSPIAPLGSSLPPMVKRGDADSAGSNHTRDSGVSVGSVGGGSKTPPSVHNTPPTHHKNPSLSQRNSSAAQREQAAVHDARTQQLNRNWQSTPDVPLETNAERNLETLQRNRSGSSSRIKTQIPKPAQVSASEESMPVHRKPVLARRGQSVTRTSSSQVNGEHEQSSLPRMNKFSGNSVRDHEGRKPFDRNGSGDHLDDDEDGGHYIQNNNVVYSYQVDNSYSKSSSLSPPELRNSVSTGNLTRDTDVIRSRIPASKSTYFEVGEDEGPRTVRLSSRREGPFGDVRASIDDDIDQGATTLPSRRNPVSKATTGRIVPTKVYKGSFREINSKKAASNGSTRNEIFPSDLKPVTSPKHALPTALGQLESSDWETNVDGFRQMVRMVRFDQDAIRNDLHNINLSGIKHLSNLRSQVCRSAILFFEELFTHLGRSMEMDCEKIAEKLLDKSADTNKFIREASGRALEAMMINVTPLKGLTCLDLFGTRHRNPVVRCMASKLTAKLVSTVGPERCLGELSERLLPMLCKLLQEGSLETRTSAKTAMSMLMTQPSFHVLLRRHVPVDILRHAQKNIDALQKF